MKRVFYLGIICLILFEIANVYFIMPMPGSQEMNSIDFAYFLSSNRMWFRGLFLLLILLGVYPAFSSKEWLASIALVLVSVVFYMTNYVMAAEAMFYQPKTLSMKYETENTIDSSRLIIGIEHDGEAKAYPIQFLGYHHQVCDSIGGKNVIITYCTVCRTGRVFEPIVNGKIEQFRLVGMDHFNAMFEDATTKSWWQQATGEAVAGKLKGEVLPEMPSTQTTLAKWLSIHPQSSIMQPDSNFQDEYASMSNYEEGRLEGNLTVYDTLSWQKKSWVAGVIVGKISKAYDWNVLKKEHVINDVVGGEPITVILSDDDKSLFAFKRNDKPLFLQNDTLFDGQTKYNLLGKSLDSNFPDLIKINVYQEYWHSWQTFRQ